MSEPEKPEGVETWKIAIDRYGIAMIYTGTSVDTTRALTLKEIGYAIHAAQRLPVVERDRIRLLAALDNACADLTMQRNALGEADGKLTAAQARIAALEEALRAIIDAADRTRVFIALRERMHPTGLSLYDEDVARARALLSKETDL